MTTRSLAASLPLGALGTLAILGVATFVAVAAVIREPIGASNGVFTVGNQASVLAVTPSAPRSLTSADVDAITRSVPGISALSRVVQGSAPVAVGSQATQLTVQGVDPSYPQVTSAAVTSGVFFGRQDASAASPVAILGRSLAARLFGGVSPVGQTIRIRGVPYTVMGVLASQASPPADSADNTVLIPLQTGQVRLFGPNTLDLVLMQVRDAGQADAVRQQVEQLLRQRHQLRVGQADNFSIANNSQAVSGDPTETTLQYLGRLVQQYRQYVCEGKGLCARTQ